MIECPRNSRIACNARAPEACKTYPVKSQDEGTFKRELESFFKEGVNHDTNKL